MASVMDLLVETNEYVDDENKDPADTEEVVEKVEDGEGLFDMSKEDDEDELQSSFYTKPIVIENRAQKRPRSEGVTMTPAPLSTEPTFEHEMGLGDEELLDDGSMDDYTDDDNDSNADKPFRIPVLDPDEPKFCYCRWGESGAMVQCSNCKEWFHDECIGLVEQEVENIITYYCAVCCAKSSRFVTTYKRDPAVLRKIINKKVKKNVITQRPFPSGSRVMVSVREIKPVKFKTPQDFYLQQLRREKRAEIRRENKRKMKLLEKLKKEEITEEAIHQYLEAQPIDEEDEENMEEEARLTGEEEEEYDEGEELEEQDERYFEREGVKGEEEEEDESDEDRIFAHIIEEDPYPEDGQPRKKKRAGSNRSRIGSAGRPRIVPQQIIGPNGEIIKRGPGRPRKDGTFSTEPRPKVSRGPPPPPIPVMGPDGVLIFKRARGRPRKDGSFPPGPKPPKKEKPPRPPARPRPPPPAPIMGPDGQLIYRRGRGRPRKDGSFPPTPKSNVAPPTPKPKVAPLSPKIKVAPLPKIKKEVKVAAVAFVMCEDCGDSFKTEKARERHWNREHRVREVIVYECETCEKKYPSTRALADHMKVHREKTNYACMFCGENFKSMNKLTSHTNSRHLNVRISCEICSRSYSNRSTLASHMKKCHGHGADTDED